MILILTWEESPISLGLLSEIFVFKVDSLLLLFTDYLISSTEKLTQGNPFSITLTWIGDEELSLNGILLLLEVFGLSLSATRKAISRHPSLYNILDF